MAMTVASSTYNNVNMVKLIHVGEVLPECVIQYVYVCDIVRQSLASHLGFAVG